MRHTVATALGTSSLLAWPTRAALSYPSRPITLVVPMPAGGEADGVARLVATLLAARLGQSVVVENVGGASGALAARRVLRAAPDGYTLLFGTTSDVVVAPISNPALAYSARDFTPIALYGVTPLALVAKPSPQLTDMAELGRYARALPNGATLSMGTTGEASLQAFAAEAVGRETRIPFTRVPYRGGQALLNDLMAGRLDLAISVLPAALRYAETGRLQILGTLSRTATDMLPVSLGSTLPIGDVSVELWAGLLGPASMDNSTVSQLNAAMASILGNEAYRTERARIGDRVAAPISPAEFAQFVLSEDTKFRALANMATPSTFSR